MFWSSCELSGEFVVCRVELLTPWEFWLDRSFEIRRSWRWFRLLVRGGRCFGVAVHVRLLIFTPFQLLLRDAMDGHSEWSTLDEVAASFNSGSSTVVNQRCNRPPQPFPDARPRPFSSSTISAPSMTLADNSHVDPDCRPGYFASTAD